MLFIKNFFYKNYNINSYSSSWFFLYFLNNFEGFNKIPESEHLSQFILGIFLLSVIALMCLFSIIYLLLCIYLINKYNIEEKFSNYPKLIYLINKSKSFNIFWIFFEFIILTIALLMIFSSLLFLLTFNK